MSRARCECCPETHDLYRCPEPPDRIDLLWFCGLHLIEHLVGAHGQWTEEMARVYVLARRKLNDGDGL